MANIEFTKEMKKDYTILIPDMTTIHFKLLRNIFQSYGYHLEILYNQGRSVIDEGLKYVHNDTCYPALLCIGQMIDALKSGKYDIHRTALMITQTGGGCRASNYIHLLRKALEKAGFGFVPVISLNFAGMEKNSGFQITIPLIRRCMAAVAYGDLLMMLNNQVKPYEITKGESEKLVAYWTKVLTNRFQKKKGFSSKQMKETFAEITRSFAEILCDRQPKIKVGIVGEIYVKYAALGNNNLEQFLYEQDCEVMLMGLLDFLLYCLQNNLEDYRLYGGSKLKYKVIQIALTYLSNIKDNINATLKAFGFCAPSSFQHLTTLADGVIERGCKMGEGWLLTAEMMELIELGYENIICVQPFGCLPNHIVGKGMIRTIKNQRPLSNIVPIDYDSGATKVNQENRIKLMLAVAKERQALQLPDKKTIEINLQIPQAKELVHI